MRLAILLCLAAGSVLVTEPDPVLVDFADAGSSPAEWRAVDDVVMGGVSRSRLRPTKEGTAVFEGRLSLENNGGFASVRTATGGMDLSRCDGVIVRVRGDGRRYRLRLRHDDRFDGVAYQAGFDTRAGEWIEVDLPFDAFEPSFRGRRPPDAAPLDRTDIRQVGFLVADRQEGDFSLEIAWVRGRPR